ncbi:MAG: hypothetical protein Q9183_001255, partial [Haloplaca sp. 2 TL-2023]
MLRDDSFSSRAKVDRYGRRLPKGAGKKELEKYYRIEEDEDISKQDAQVAAELARANAEELDDNSSSAEESSSEESGSDESEEEEVFGLLEGQGSEGGEVPMGDVTSRIAVVNLDWDNIRAADLMAVFTSFLASAGQIKKISIYPSEFGKERIQREEMEGPPKEIFSQKNASKVADETFSGSKEEDGDSSAEEDDEKIKQSLIQEDTNQEFNSAKLRRYQLERLRYYYAVMVCSSPAVAQTIYEAVDGTEYLTTANFFDLRFIPDDTDFSQDTPRDECTRIPDGYRPNEFITDALQHSRVRLTWDADDSARKEVQKRAFAASRANIDENDLKAYLGSDTSDSEADNPEPVVVDATAETIPETGQTDLAPSTPTVPILSKKEVERQRMRSLLGLSSEPTASTSQRKSRNDPTAPVGDMQITFSSGLQPSTSDSVFVNSPDTNAEETTVEKYIRKEKERKARRKAKTKGGIVDTEPDEPTTATKTTTSTDDAKQADLGFNDPFFADPSSTTQPPKTNADRKEARRLKRTQKAAEEAASAAQKAELELLTMDDHRDPDNNNNNNKDTKHFNINEIVKAEKALSKKSKKRSKKGKERDKVREAEEVREKDGFRIDTQDERFGAVYDR